MLNGAPLVGLELPDTDQNGEADVFEEGDPSAAVPNGQILAGLSGVGCSIDGGDTKSPFMPLLAALAFFGINIRRKLKRTEK